MSPENNTPSKICPTCGTRLSENASRCLVCGRTFTVSAAAKRSKSVRAQKLPDVTLSLPLALGLLFIVLAVGGGIIFLILRSTGQVAAPEATATASPTPTFEQSPTPTVTLTPEPTYTPLPPIEYQIRDGDSCGLVAVIYEVSINSIVELNNLPPNCGVLTVGQILLVPQPTPTPSPMPTSTLSVGEATDSACLKIEYRVGENDTLSGIAANYAVSVETLKTYNGITSNNIYSGQIIVIPRCDQFLIPTAGPTPTPTLPPPYPPSNLLLPADGSVFSGTSETVTLQWAAIGGLLESELYAVTIEDLTEGQGKKLVDYTSDTKYNIPTTFRPRENAPHVIRWWVQPVRQSGTTDDGDTIWVPAGSQSTPRVFAWSGIGAVVTQAP
ncbi:MAG: LysM peptidoglycan-binding domain-containing protein [Pelolinea sp.]|nr:LysM peptidoglycan-binding domain-containing protein [Pelolinea sp.]